MQGRLGSLEKQEPILKNELKAFDEALKTVGTSAPLTIVNLQSKIADTEASVGDITKIINKMKAEVINPRVSVSQFAAEPKNKDYTRQIKFAGAGGFGIFFWCSSASPSWNSARGKSAARTKCHMAWA